MTNQRFADEGYMQLALDQAKIALAKDWIPIGAVFVKDGDVITHARKEGKRHTLFDHAEHNGCYQTLWNRGGPQNLGGFTVYSTLEPCVMCMSMLMTVRVSRIVWAEDDPAGGGSFMFRHPDELPGRFKAERPALHRGVLQEESRALLRRFFEPKIGGGGHWSDPNNALVRLVMGE